MGGKSGKHGHRSRGNQSLPTSAERKRFLKRKIRANKTRVTSRAGKLLDKKWATQFVDAGYKYVFEQVPMKGNIPSSRIRRFPGEPETVIPAHMSKRTPKADIVFGNDLSDLKFFDSKRQYTSTFTMAQRQVYPIINERGGRIILKDHTSLINLVDGKPVDIDGVVIRPGTAHVGFHVDLSAVASGQVDLNSLLHNRSGNLHPPASDLALEDSRMNTERRAQYRGPDTTELSGGRKDRGVSKRGLENNPIESEQKPRPKNNTPSSRTVPKSKTLTPDLDPPNLKKRLIPNRIRIYGEGSRQKEVPKLKADKADRKLLHESHRDFILVWDKEVHHIAQMYRELARKSMNQLNRIHDEVIASLKHFTSRKEEKNAITWITKEERRIEAALQVYNFNEAKIQAKSFRQ